MLISRLLENLGVPAGIAIAIAIVGLVVKLYLGAKNKNKSSGGGGGGSLGGGLSSRRQRRSRRYD
jgi:hypothetical protein